MIHTRLNVDTYSQSNSEEGNTHPDRALRWPSMNRANALVRITSDTVMGSQLDKLPRELLIHIALSFTMPPSRVNTASSSLTTTSIAQQLENDTEFVRDQLDSWMKANARVDTAIYGVVFLKGMIYMLITLRTESCMELVDMSRTTADFVKKRMLDLIRRHDNVDIIQILHIKEM